MRLTKANHNWLICLGTTQNQRMVRQIIKYINTQQQRIISEIVLNPLHGAIPFSKQDKRKLNIYKKTLRDTASNTLSETHRGRQFAKIVEIIPTLIRNIFKYYESRDDLTSKGKVRKSDRSDYQQEG